MVPGRVLTKLEQLDYEYYGGKTLQRKNIIKTGQKFTEMGILLEFVGNPRNSSQGIFIGLMQSYEYI